MGVDIDGFKDILGIWIGESESAKFWLYVLNELKNRGVEERQPLSQSDLRMATAPPFSLPLLMA